MPRDTVSARVAAATASLLVSALFLAFAIIPATPVALATGGVA